MLLNVKRFACHRLAVFKGDFFDPRLSLFEQIVASFFKRFTALINADSFFQFHLPGLKPPDYAFKLRQRLLKAQCVDVLPRLRFIRHVNSPEQSVQPIHTANPR